MAYFDIHMLKRCINQKMAEINNWQPFQISVNTRSRVIDRQYSKLVGAGILVFIFQETE